MARDLVAAGASVRGFDPAGGEIAGVERAADARAAVTGSDVVLSLTAASVAVEAAGDAAGGLRAGQVYADLNASGAALKRAVAERIEPTGASFADVALMGVGPARGTAHAGAGLRAREREAFAARLRRSACRSRSWATSPGRPRRASCCAACFMKGLAAASVESLRAARAAGCEDVDARARSRPCSPARTPRCSSAWSPAARATRRAASPRSRDARELLGELGVEPRVTAAAGGWLAQLEQEGSDVADEDLTPTARGRELVRGAYRHARAHRARHRRADHRRRRPGAPLPGARARGLPAEVALHLDRRARPRRQRASSRGSRSSVP